MNSLKLSRCVSNLDVKWKSVLFEGIKIKNQWLATLCQRGDVAVAVYINGLALQNLSKKE